MNKTLSLRGGSGYTGVNKDRRFSLRRTKISPTIYELPTRRSKKLPNLTEMPMDDIIPLDNEQATLEEYNSIFSEIFNKMKITVKNSSYVFSYIIMGIISLALNCMKFLKLISDTDIEEFETADFKNKVMKIAKVIFKIIKRILKLIKYLCKTVTLGFAGGLPCDISVQIIGFWFICFFIRFLYDTYFGKIIIDLIINVISSIILFLSGWDIRSMYNQFIEYYHQLIRSITFFCNNFLSIVTLRENLPGAINNIKELMKGAIDNIKELMKFKTDQGTFNTGVSNSIQDQGTFNTRVEQFIRDQETFNNGVDRFIRDQVGVNEQQLTIEDVKIMMKFSMDMVIKTVTPIISAEIFKKINDKVIQKIEGNALLLSNMVEQLDTGLSRIGDLEDKTLIISNKLNTLSIEQMKILIMEAYKEQTIAASLIGPALASFGRGYNDLPEIKNIPYNIKEQALQLISDGIQVTSEGIQNTNTNLMSMMSFLPSSSSGIETHLYKLFTNGLLSSSMTLTNLLGYSERIWMRNKFRESFDGGRRTRKNRPSNHKTKKYRKNKGRLANKSHKSKI